MKADTLAGHQRSATTVEKLRTNHHVTARTVVHTGGVETVYSVDGQPVGGLDELRALLRCSR